MKKLANIIFIVAFLCLTLFPLAFTKSEAGAVSDIDGSVLYTMHQRGSIEFTAGIEEWLRDRLGYRSDMIRAYEEINDKLLGELVNPVYQYGLDKYTFFRMHNNIRYSEYHKKFAEMVSEMQKYCESRGIGFYYVFNPEKESVYRQYLPPGVNYDDTWVDSMLEYMEELGVNYIDLREVLDEKSHKVGVFNRVYDAGHWNEEGAFYGMQALTRRMQEENKEISILDKSEYDISTRIADKIYGSSLSVNEKVPLYMLKSGYTDITPESLSAEIKIDSSFPNVQIVRNESSRAAEINRMLVFQDVLYGQFMFSRAMETISISCLQNAINYDYYINLFDPDVVVFENMEYVVNDAYFSETTMDEAIRNPTVMKVKPAEMFADRKEQLLAKGDRLSTDAAAMIVSGNCMDKVFISETFDEYKYAYLITDKKCIDLKRDYAGVFTASVLHEDIPVGSEVVIYLMDENRQTGYDVIPVRTIAESRERNVVKYIEKTANTEYDKVGSRYTMNTVTEGNTFSGTTVQLFNEDMTEYIENLQDVTVQTGLIEGEYCHNGNTGDYSILLKGNSNIADEWIRYKAHLVNDKIYWFSYSVDEMAEDHIVLSSLTLHTASK